MRSNIKKSILAVALFSGISLSIGAAAINTKNNFINDELTPISSTKSNADTRAEETLTIWSPWTEGGVQDYALREIVNVWNGIVDAGTAPTGAMKVEVKTITTGYSGITSAVQEDLKVGRISELPDMYINYADTTASLIKFGNDYQNSSFALDLTGQDATSTIDEMIIPAMASQNSMIAGGDEGAIYSIPFATSSELMGIDAPLFVWLLQSYIEAGGTITYEGEVMKQIVDAADGFKDGSVTTIDLDAGGEYVSSGTVVYSAFANGKAEEALPGIETLVINPKDKEQIEKFWKSTGADLTGSTLEINDDTFASANGMLNLSKELLKASTGVSGDISGKPDQAVYGYDAAVNNFYTYAQAETDSLLNPEDGIIYKDGENVVYSMLEQDSDAWNTSIDLFDYFAESFRTGSAWTSNNGISYGSDLIKNHQMAFSIGSTAGATYYYDTKDAGLVNPGDLVYTQAPGKLNEDDTNNVQMQQGPSFGAVKQFNNDNVKDGVDEERNEAISIFMDFLVGSDEYEFSTGIKSVYVLPTTYDDLKDDVLADDGSHPLTDTTNPIDVDTDLDDTGKHFAADYVADGKYTDSYGDEWSYATIEGTTDYVMADSYYGIELFGFDGTNPTKAISVTSTSSTDTITPSRYMSSESNYIVGTTAVFEDAEYTAQLADETIQSNGKWSGETFTVYNNSPTAYSNNAGLIGPSIAYQNIQGSVDGEIELELEPYSITTNSYRDEIKSAIVQQKTDSVNGKEIKSSEDIMIDIHNTSVKNGWFEGKKITVWEWWMTLLVIIASLTVIGLIAFLIYWFVFKNKSTTKI